MIESLLNGASAAIVIAMIIMYLQQRKIWSLRAEVTKARTAYWKAQDTLLKAQDTRLAEVKHHNKMLDDWHILTEKIRKHRDARGHNRCKENDLELYKLLFRLTGDEADFVEPSIHALSTLPEWIDGCTKYYFEQCRDNCSAEEFAASLRRVAVETLTEDKTYDRTKDNCP